MYVRMCACSVLLRFDKQARHGAARAAAAALRPSPFQGANATAWPQTEDPWLGGNQTTVPGSVGWRAKGLAGFYLGRGL